MIAEHRLKWNGVVHFERRLYNEERLVQISGANLLQEQRQIQTAQEVRVKP
jgi:hypothetical protein